MTDPPDRLKAALAHRYAMEREIGAGGMATVYLAQDLKHQRKVAVKVLRPDLAATGRQALTTAGVALGTPTYMAPEQAAADPLKDQRAEELLGVLEALSTPSGGMTPTETAPVRGVEEARSRARRLTRPRRRSLQCSQRHMVLHAGKAAR